jgi:hypothetical protein
MNQQRSHAFLSSIELNQDHITNDSKHAKLDGESLQGHRISAAKDNVVDPRRTNHAHFLHSSASSQRQTGVALRALSHRSSPTRIRPSSSTTLGPVLGPAQAQASRDFLTNISLSSPASPPLRPGPCRPAGPNDPHAWKSVSPSPFTRSPPRESIYQTPPSQSEPVDRESAEPGMRTNPHRVAGFARSVDFLSSISLGASAPTTQAPPPSGVGDVSQTGSAARRRASTPPVSSRATPSPVRPPHGIGAAGLGTGDDLSPIAAATDAAWGGLQRSGRPATLGGSGGSAGARGRGAAEREEEAGSGAQWARLLLDNLALAAWPLAQSPPDSPM